MIAGINNQWRIIFKWENNNASEVEIIDYHKKSELWKL